MNLRRRNFLGLIGAAAAAPLMPMGASAAGYSRAGYAAAIAHAKRYPLVTVSGMAKRTGLPVKEVEAIVGRMSSEGMLGMLNPTRPGTIRASSKIFTKDVYGLVRTSQPRPAARTTQAEPQKTQPKPQAAQAQPVTDHADALMAHLHQLCRSYGMALAPRCAAVRGFA